MALTAGQKRWFIVNVRSKAGMKSGNMKSLHDLGRTIRDDTSIEIADYYARQLRKKHSQFVASASKSIEDKTLREVLMRHSHFKGGSLTLSSRSTTGLEPKAFVYAKLFSPLGTMSTAMHVTYRKLKDGSIKLYIRGADIYEQEFGTGTLGERNPHPASKGLYNRGKTITTDKATGIKYWVYGQYARVGSPSGHFQYDAHRLTKRYVNSYEFKNSVSSKMNSKINEALTAVIASTLSD